MSKKTEAFPPRVCLALERMEACRENEKAREADLVKHRKQVKQDFLNLGPGETNAHKTTAFDLVKTLLHIDYCRVRQSTLADQIGETIRGAHQPGLFGDDHDLEGIFSREPDDEELFATLRKPAKDPDQQELGDSDDRPIGEPETAGKRAKPEGGFRPGKWEIQEVGKRGRGPTLAFETVEQVYADVDGKLASEEAFTVTFDGETGEVKAGGKVVMRLKRRGDFDAAPEAPGKEATKPQWRKGA